MKKIVIFTMILSFVFIGTLSAQGNLGFGVKGGLNMAKFTGGDADLDMEGLNSDPGFIFGPTIGGFVTYKLNDKLTIQPEFLYTAKGTSYEYSESYSEDGFSLSYDGTVDMKMNWLDIPVLVVFSVNDQIKVFAGPFLELFLNGKMDYEITVKATYDGETITESESDSEDIESEDVTSPGFGLIFGGAYMLSNNLGVEARYSLGLTSMDEDISMKNSSIQVLVNYYLKK